MKQDTENTLKMSQIWRRLYNSRTNKKAAHLYFLRPVIFDELKIFHRTKNFKDDNNHKLDIDLINRYENETRGLINKKGGL